MDPACNSFSGLARFLFSILSVRPPKQYCRTVALGFGLVLGGQDSRNRASYTLLQCSSFSG